MRADLDVQRATRSAGIPGDDQFRRWVGAVPVEHDLDYVLAIRIVGEREARRTNRDYRKRDYATNVLSFPAELPEGLPDELRRSHLGDLMICAPVVAREAVKQKRPEADHWAHLTIHGLLHLLGYDHERPEDASVMETLETKILASLGIPDPYTDNT